jgi:hypothetical protein
MQPWPVVRWYFADVVLTGPAKKGSNPTSRLLPIKIEALVELELVLHRVLVSHPVV